MPAQTLNNGGLSEEDIQMLRDQLLIAIVKRTGEIKIPVTELDETGDTMLELQVDQQTREFILVTKKKN